jgi:deoxycytidylate deaminase
MSRTSSKPVRTHFNYDTKDVDTCKVHTTQQAYFLKKCFELAQRSNLTHKHGCIIVKKNEIVSSGFNFKLQNYHTTIPTFSASTFKARANESCFSVHAEVSTIKKAKKIDLRQCDMYVVRISNGSGMCDSKNATTALRYSHPCSTCSKYISAKGIRRVYYSVNTVNTICDANSDSESCISH